MSDQRSQVTVHVNGPLSIELSTDGATTLISRGSARRNKSRLLSRLFGFRRGARTSTTMVSDGGSATTSNRGIIASGRGTSVVQRATVRGNASVIQHAGGNVVGGDITQLIGGSNTGIISIGDGAIIAQGSSGSLQINHPGAGQSDRSTVLSVPDEMLVIVHGTKTVNISEEACAAGITFKLV